MLAPLPCFLQPCSLALLPAGQDQVWASSCSGEGSTLRVWCPATGQITREHSTPCAAYALGSGGPALIVGQGEEGALHCVVDGPTCDLSALSPCSGQWAAPGCNLALNPAEDSVAWLRDPSTLSLSSPGASFDVHLASCVPDACCIAWSSDGRLLFVGGLAGEVVACVPPSQAGSAATAFPLPADSASAPTAMLATHEHEQLLVGREGGNVEVWDLRRRQRLFTFKAPAAGSPAVAFAQTEDAKQVLALHANGTVVVLAIN